MNSDEHFRQDISKKIDLYIMYLKSNKLYKNAQYTGQVLREWNEYFTDDIIKLVGSQKIGQMLDELRESMTTPLRIYNHLIQRILSPQEYLNIETLRELISHIHHLNDFDTDTAIIWLKYIFTNVSDIKENKFLLNEILYHIHKNEIKITANLFRLIFCNFIKFGMSITDTLMSKIIIQI